MNPNANRSSARSVNAPQCTAPLHFPIYFPPAHPVPLLHRCSVQHPPGLVTHFSTQSSPLALLPVAGSLGNGTRDGFSTKMSGLCHNFFVWWIKAPCKGTEQLAQGTRQILEASRDFGCRGIGCGLEISKPEGALTESPRWGLLDLKENK